MWDVCTNTLTTGQRKNKQGPRLQAVSKDCKNVTKLFLHFSICATMLLAGSGPTTSLAETVNHGLAEAGHQTRPLAEVEHRTTQQGKKVGLKLHETWIENITRHLNTDSRAHGVFSTREQNVAASVATSQRLAVTTEQTNAYDWAESPK